MYIHLMTEEEQKAIVRALRGPQFDRKRHGGLYDRGSADSYYGRARDPHWWPQGTSHGKKVVDLTQDEIAEYNAGYDWNERFGDRKDYR